MRATIRKMGNSQGILIPKPILAQLGLEIDKMRLIRKEGAVSGNALTGTLRVLQDVFAE